MVAVIQRVSTGSVYVDGEKISEIGRGILVFLGVERDDSERDVSFLANKISNLRIFEDSSGKMNLSIREVGGEVLVVSEFTLAGDCHRGNRPSFDRAMPPNEAEGLYRLFIESLKSTGIPVKEGRFRSFMRVYLINDGPVTFILNSR